DEGMFLIEPPADDLLALDEAIQLLKAEEPRLGEIVLLRYYAGLSVEETAGVIGRSVSTVMREWRQARAWLAARANPAAGGAQEEGRPRPTPLGPVRPGGRPAAPGAAGPAGRRLRGRPRPPRRGGATAGRRRPPARRRGRQHLPGQPRGPLPAAHDPRPGAAAPPPPPPPPPPAPPGGHGPPPPSPTG